MVGVQYDEQIAASTGPYWHVFFIILTSLFVVAAIKVESLLAVHASDICVYFCSFQR